MPRPTKPLVIDGKHIDGLYRYPNSNKYRINATGTKFTADDPRKAVMRFRQWEAKQGGKTVDLQQLLRPGMRLGHDFTDVIEDHEDVNNYLPPTSVDENAFWARVTEEILRRPQYVAERTGIEQIGYLTDLRKPTPSPTLTEVGELYFSKAKVKAQWLTKSKQHWCEFCDSVGVATLRELTQEMVVDYADARRGV